MLDCVTGSLVVTGQRPASGEQSKTARCGKTSVVKGELRHPIVLSIPCPQPSAARHGTRGNKSIAKFNCMAFVVTPQVFSCPTADRCVCGHANKPFKQGFQYWIFRRLGASPKFSRSYGREEDQRIGFAQFIHFATIVGLRPLETSMRMSESTRTVNDHPTCRVWNRDADA